MSVKVDMSEWEDQVKYEGMESSVREALKVHGLSLARTMSGYDWEVSRNRWGLFGRVCDINIRLAGVHFANVKLRDLAIIKSVADEVKDGGIKVSIAVTKT